MSLRHIPIKMFTLGMFLLLSKSSTSKRRSTGTPNSKRSLMIFSILSLGFMCSSGRERCLLPRGVGQLFRITSSIILNGGWFAPTRKPNLKGTVSRDFLLLVFLMNQFPHSPKVFHLDRFEFFRKFSESTTWWCTLSCEYLREFSKNPKWP